MPFLLTCMQHGDENPNLRVFLKIKEMLHAACLPHGQAQGVLLKGGRGSSSYHIVINIYN